MASMIHLIRHGEVSNPDHVVYARLPGFGLSDLGRAQASEAGRYLAARPVVAVWTSPLERAVTTAQLVAPAGIPVRVHSGLTEWHLADSWAGIVWESLPTERPGQLERYLATPWDLDFGNESLAELAQRVCSVIEELDERHPNGDVVIVSHQDPVQAARLRLTGRPLHDLATDKPGHATVFSLRHQEEWEEVARWDASEAEPFPPKDGQSADDSDSRNESMS